MVTTITERQRPQADPRRDMSPDKPGRVGPLVAFDFDGTLTVHDSFRAFLRWQVGERRYAAGLFKLIPDAFSYLFHRNRGRLKAAMVRIYLKGMTREALEQATAAFAAEAAPRLLRPDALMAWRRWRRDGARLVIVSASPEQLIAPFARGLGADLVLATRLEFDHHDRLTGRLDGSNCRSEEKVHRLREAFGEDVRLAAAYGDTAGDEAMLAIADGQFMKVFTARPTGQGTAG
jgi:phosphatidylglycerophosphatase C